MGAAVLTAAVSSSAAPLGGAFIDGPPLAVTGAFGELTCHQCHFDNELNAAGGAISITGLPGQYVPGRRYRLTVSLSRSGLANGGFQLAARFADGEHKGRDAGGLTAPDARTAIRHDGRSDVDYAQHSGVGSAPTTSDTVSWHLEWTAPAAGSTVAFSVAAVAGSGDRSQFDDFVYVHEMLTSGRSR